MPGAIDFSLPGYILLAFREQTRVVTHENQDHATFFCLLILVAYCFDLLIETGLPFPI